VSQNNIAKPQDLNFLKSWMMAIRPKTLTASISPVLLTYAFIVYKQPTAPSASIFLTTLFCALFMQIATNLVNDYYDGVQGIDNEDRLGPTRVVAGGIIPARRVQFGFQICFFLAFLLGVYLMIVGGKPIIIIGICSLIAAYAYTGGPIPLSRYGLGEVLAFIFFGPVACIGTAILLGYENFSEIRYIAEPMGLWSAALMSVNNLRDISADTNAKKTTVATLLGEKKARIFTFILLLSPFLMHFYAIQKLDLHWSLYLPAFAILPLIEEFHRILKSPISAELNLTLAQTGKTLTIYTVINVIVYFVL
jgi:1,4-dihydroxy-2-naphthoate octaprenyltransferase